MSSILTSDAIITDSLSKTSIPSGEYGAPIQTRFKHFTHRSSQSLTGDSTPTVNNVITNFQSSITPRKTGNKILIGVQWCGEIDDLWNAAFMIKRTTGGTFAFTEDFGNQTVGWNPAMQAGTATGFDTYAAAAENNASTPASCTFWVWDGYVSSTNITTYALAVRCSQNETIYTNRTQSDTDNDQHERFQSWMCLMEFSGG